MPSEAVRPGAQNSIVWPQNGCHISAAPSLPGSVAGLVLTPASLSSALVTSRMRKDWIELVSLSVAN